MGTSGARRILPRPNREIDSFRQNSQVVVLLF